MQKEIDIDQYDYFELLDVYKLSPHMPYDEMLEYMDDYLATIKSNFDSTIFSFYLQAYTLILSIHKLLKVDNISPERGALERAEKQVRSIANFERYSVDNIVAKLRVVSADDSRDRELAKYTSLLSQSAERISFPPENKHHINTIVNAAPANVAPSELNTVKRVTQITNLNLNSCFRDNYAGTSSSNFSYILPTDVKNVVSLKLTSVELPTSWYTFSSSKNNSRFWLKISVGKGKPKQYTIIIPDGNYTDTELTSYLNTSYFADSCAASELKYLRFAINKYSKKSSFEIIPSEACPSFKFSLVFSETMEGIMLTAGWILGFRSNYYKLISDNISSEGLYNEGNDRYIYVSIDDFQNNTNNLSTVCLSNSTIEKHIIAKIPYINNHSIVTTQQNLFNAVRKYTGPVNLVKFNVKLLDKYGDTIDLNYMDFGFTLEVEILYENFTFQTRK